jgi:voltage-gated potassium channel
MTPQSEQLRSVGPYQFFMLALCAWTLLLLGAGSFVRLDPATQVILDYADTAVCVIFFADFVGSFARAPRRLHYLATWGWIDLLSSIPSVGVFRWGRAARVMRILRVIRGLKSARTIAHFLAAKREESAFLASLLLCLLMIISCSIAVLQFEVPAGGNIQSAQDALWWAVSTMTTVGYGDRYPISAEGRVVAIFLMAAGVGLFGILSGLVASWFLSPAVKETDTDVEELKGMIKELQEQVRSERRNSIQTSETV